MNDCDFSALISFHVECKLAAMSRCQDAFGEDSINNAGMRDFVNHMAQALERGRLVILKTHSTEPYVIK